MIVIGNLTDPGTEKFPPSGLAATLGAPERA